MLAKEHTYQAYHIHEVFWAMLISCPRGKCSEFPAVSLLVDSLKWNVLFGGEQANQKISVLSIYPLVWHHNMKKKETLLRMEAFVRLIASALEMWESCLRKWNKQKVKRPLRMCSNVRACVISTKWWAGASPNTLTIIRLAQKPFQLSSLSQRATSSWYTLKSGGTLPDQFSTAAPNCKAQTYDRNNNQPPNYKYDQIWHGKAWHALTNRHRRKNI